MEGGVGGSYEDCGGEDLVSSRLVSLFVIFSALAWFGRGHSLDTPLLLR